MHVWMGNFRYLVRGGRPAWFYRLSTKVDLRTLVLVFLARTRPINKKILLPCFSVTGMAPEDKHIAVSWVGVAYTGMLCVCLGGNAVLRRAEFANCTSVQMVSACVLGAVVVLCAVVSCCSSVVSCGCLVFRNTQVHSCFLSPHLSNDDCPFPLLHLYDHPTEDPTPVPLQQQHQHQHQHQCHYRHQHQRREER